MSSPVTRLTLFKIPKDEDQHHLLDLCKEIPQKAVKNGKPYITSVQADKAKPDQRAQGFTIVAISTFKSEEEFDYYDKEFPAYVELRTFAKSVNGGVAMVYFENEVVLLG
ncbi:hypothetical protein FZEAL_1009 [Fusarium zealandicum]|uniref:Stress-response A/B barrel domain-containing protein n=1 Tax=Fusarium zealandicum TaxID=1053134 RepID=A0A8H4UU98_9HYPO|nr:hypothetical protein FZEAL_1009 [Fusarium zealandicum]